MTTRGSYVHNPMGNFSRVYPKDGFIFLQISQNIDDFRQNNSEGFFFFFGGGGGSTLAPLHFHKSWIRHCLLLFIVILCTQSILCTHYFDFLSLCDYCSLSVYLLSVFFFFFALQWFPSETLRLCRWCRKQALLPNRERTDQIYQESIMITPLEVVPHLNVLILLRSSEQSKELTLD